MGGDKTMVVEAWNSVGAQVGDEVRINLSSRSVLGAAFLLYVLPLLVFLGGLMVGQSLMQNQLWAVALGFVLMAALYGGIRILDRRLSRANKLRPEIVEVVARASPNAPESQNSRVLSDNS